MAVTSDAMAGTSGAMAVTSDAIAAELNGGQYMRTVQGTNRKLNN